MNTVKRRAPVFVLFLMLGSVLAGSLGGCAPKQSNANWRHPALPKDAWAADFGECRRYARREVEREAGLPAAGTAADNMGGGLSTYNTQMSRYELARFQERAFAGCMRRLGYVPISK